MVNRIALPKRTRDGDARLKDAWDYYGATFGFVGNPDNYNGKHFECAFHWDSYHGGHTFVYKNHRYNYSCSNHAITHECCEKRS